MTKIQYLAETSKTINSLMKINSAILSGVPIVVGYTTRNLRYGVVAEHYLHIAGRPVFWPIGYASPNTVGDELQEHAATLGKKAIVMFAKTCNERGQTGSLWWEEGSHLDRFKIKDWAPE